MQRFFLSVTKESLKILHPHTDIRDYVNPNKVIETIKKL